MPARDSTADRASVKAFALNGPAGFLACGFGSGLAPVAPGTFGTLAAVPLALLLSGVPELWRGLILLLAFVLGLYLAKAAEAQLGRADHGAVVWDEMVGFALAVFLLPPEWLTWIIALVCFRVLDILKPWPIGWLDRNLRGGWGVMMDDVVAGGLTLLIVLGLQRWVLGGSGFRG